MIRNRSVSYPSAVKNERDKKFEEIIKERDNLTLQIAADTVLNMPSPRFALEYVEPADEQLIQQMIACAFNMQLALMSAPEKMPRISGNVILSQADLDRINGIPPLNENIVDRCLEIDNDLQEARPDGLY